MPSNENVVVIGAGVIGLTNAVFLAEAGYTVTIVAAHVPGNKSIEYTSPWAGALWRTHATRKDPELCDWDLQTMRFWEELLAEEANDVRLEKCGIKRATSSNLHAFPGWKMQQAFYYWDGPVTDDIWWAPYVKDFRQLSLVQNPVLAINTNRPPHAPAILWAASSKTPSIDVNRYLLYLLTRAQKSGAILFQSRLPTDGGLPKALESLDRIADALGRHRSDVFINCSGLGARQLCNDEKLFPIRGQTVLVRGEAVATRTRHHCDSSTSYCIPRPGSGTTILGGTRERGNASPVVNPDTTQTILEKCRCLAPELLTSAEGGFEVISEQCGLRPGREGGPRVERERAAEMEVVHAYGHAGAGYQASVGCARKVLDLVGEAMGRSVGGEFVGAKL